MFEVSSQLLDFTTAPRFRVLIDFRKSNAGHWRRVERDRVGTSAAKGINNEKRKAR